MPVGRIRRAVERLEDARRLGRRYAGPAIDGPTLLVAVIVKVYAVPFVRPFTVSGPAAIMNTLQIGQVHAVVNLKDTSLVRDSHLPVEISAPNNVTITSVDPSGVLVIIPPPPEKKP